VPAKGRWEEIPTTSSPNICRDEAFAKCPHRGGGSFPGFPFIVEDLAPVMYPRMDVV